MDDDDVEVVYDVPYGGGGNNSKNTTGNTKISRGRSNGHKNRNNSGGGRSNNSNSNGNNTSGIIGNYVDFENVFDPFAAREQDDVREFFDDEEEDTFDLEKPNMFNDPRKVRTGRTGEKVSRSTISAHNKNMTSQILLFIDICFSIAPFFFFPLHFV